MRLILAFVFAATFWGNSSAHADPVTIWSMNAASCVPAQAAGTNYSISGGAVTNVVAQLQYFYCPIPYDLRALNGATHTLTLYYAGNSNYTCTGLCSQFHFVEANVVAMSRSTGAETTVVSLGSVTSSTFASVSSAFSHTFDLDANVYYVRIRVSGNTSNPQTVYAVALKDS